MTEETKSAILIAGPTASGKSALALALADEHNGVIINADSMQVYRELRILTARPGVADEAQAPHRLYGHVAGAEGYSAGRYCKDAAKAIAATREEGRMPIIVGGTGLYFRALLQGLAPIPEIAPEVRAHWRAAGERLGAVGLHKELQRRDPQMAERLRPTDPQRLMRALEVLEGTGKSLAYWQALPGVPVLKQDDTQRLLVMPERDILYQRCDRRFTQMLKDGAVDEVRALCQLNLDGGLPIMRALGVRPLMEYLHGKATLELAIERSKTETRQFAKRQLTWLRRNMNAWTSVFTK